MSNTRLWDKLGKTDPGQTKSFKRAGGFSGTAIKPMWSFRRMTEEFGPCGVGWGVSYNPAFQVVEGSDGEVLVYCTVSVWYQEPGKERSDSVFGVGGDKVVVKQSSGLRSDDEAFKKAYTDAIGNALKLIGVGADVHMGLFDDSKYVNEMRQEFSDAPQKPSSKAVEPQKTFVEYLSAITSAKDQIALRKAWEEMNADASLSQSDFDQLNDATTQRRDQLGSKGKTTAASQYVPPNFDAGE